MKKLKYILLIILLFPINVLAYSNYIIPGGENIGIELKYEGLLVIGFYKIDNKYNENGLKVGDYIISVEDEKVESVNHLIELIEKYQQDNKVKLVVKRDNNLINIDFNLIKKDNIFKTGLYIKDSITGIGTLTYIDPETKIYGALGHEVVESATNKIVEVKTGNIFRSSVSNIERSINGTPGTKNAIFYYKDKYGEINKNTSFGIYGTYEDIKDKKTVEIKNADNINLGKATILTVTEKNDVKEYEINITKIDKKAKKKNIYFEITDKELLEKTGGIVQGMSGSPIMQDGYIIGAVTHVVVEDVKKGYGIFITTMLEEGER